MKQASSPAPIGRRPPFDQGHSHGFTLVEMLVVISVIALMMVVARPAVEAISGANSVSKSAADLSGLIRYSRAYALSNNTYVRLAFYEAPPSGTRMTPSIRVIPLYAADGIKGGDMANPQKWRNLGAPLALENLEIDDALLSSQSALSQDYRPTPNPSNGLGTDIPAVQRSIPSISSTPVKLDGFLQFTPLGEISVRSDELVRHIAIACDRPEGSGQRGINPFVIRISGANGTVQTLRKEDL